MHYGIRGLEGNQNTNDECINIPNDRNSLLIKPNSDLKKGQEEI